MRLLVMIWSLWSCLCLRLQIPVATSPFIALDKKNSAQFPWPSTQPRVSTPYVLHLVSNSVKGFISLKLCPWPGHSKLWSPSDYPPVSRLPRDSSDLASSQATRHIQYVPSFLPLHFQCASLFIYPNPADHPRASSISPFQDPWDAHRTTIV